MRQGRTFKRCTHCGSRIPDRRCPKCGHDRFTWAYVVDTAPKGAKRQQRTKAGFATKDKALDDMHRMQAAKSDGTYIEPSKLIVRQYLEQWLAGLSSQRASTRSAYEVICRVHVFPAIGNVPVQQLTKAQVKAMYEELRRSGRANGKRGGLSVKSVHNIHLALRKAFADAVDDGLLRANPAERAHKLTTDRPEMETWSAPELRLFLERLEGDDNFPLWRLASNTGMRRGELLGLRWRDVDLDTTRLSVRQQLSRAGDKVSFGAPKTQAGRRSIMLDALTVDVLRSHRARQSKGRLALGEAYRAELDLVFARADGSPLDPDVISQQFEAAGRRAGVKRIRFHDLRHTHASLALQAGVHAKVVQERLGHSTIAVTLNTYSHVIPALQEDAAARIAAVVDGA